MPHFFCTLFDKNYLSRGLTLLDSLERTCKDFQLYILCMDDFTFDYLTSLKSPSLVPLRLTDFEDTDLLKVKPTRNQGEYCWTCTPALMVYIFKNFPKVKELSYIDSDLYFFSDVEPLFKDIGSASVAIIPHNFSKDLREKYPTIEKTSGIYNVGLVYFKNDKQGLACLTWWRDQCLDWCFADYKDGKMGDQLYLNVWPEKFKDVKVLTNPGYDLAGWNIKNYTLTFESPIKVDNQPLVFYHFHMVDIYKDHTFDIRFYNLDSKVVDHIYKPYVAEVVSKGIPYGFAKRETFSEKLTKFVNSKFYHVKAAVLNPFVVLRNMGLSFLAKLYHMFVPVPLYKVAKTASLMQKDLISIGKGSEIQDYVLIRAFTAKVTIGDNTQVNPFTVIYGHNAISIGNNVMIGPHVMLASGNHDYVQTEKPMRFAGNLTKGPITIEDNVWIGANSVITDGVLIGHDALVGAGSVVTKSVKPFDIVGGVPAKVLGNRKSLAWKK